MPGTVTASKASGTRCAVFKIGLKGRFGYIDERTEELLGYSSDELFGKSIFEYVSDPTHELIERILSRRNRYESLYESFPFSIRCRDKHYRTFPAFMTQNYVNGSPANFQVVLAPPSPHQADEPGEWPAAFLALLARPRAEVSSAELVEIFRTAGGYTEAACWLIRPDNTLQSADQASSDLPSILPPPYLLPFLEDKVTRFSFRAEDRAHDERFGADLSEAIFFLAIEENSWVLLLLRHEIGYQPSARQVNDLQVMVQLWNRQADHVVRSAGKVLTLLGEMYDLSRYGLAAITDDFAVVYKNASFVRELEGEDHGETDFSSVWGMLRLQNHLGAPMPFDTSPVFDAIAARGCRMARLGLPGGEHDFLVAATPWKTAGTYLTLASFLPLAVAESRDTQIAQSARALVPTVINGLQTPLTVMATIAAHIGHTEVPQKPEDLNLAAGSLLAQTGFIRHMLDGLSEIVRVWSAEEPSSQVNTAAIIREAVPSAGAAVRDYDVLIDDSIPELFAPPQKLSRLFCALLHNAFTYAATSGRPIIRIEHSRDNRWHRFAVADNGPGIGAEYTQKIFEPFFRAPEVMHLPGVGIGLTLAREIILSLGGAIWCDATSGGCRIVFTLPAEERPRP